MTNSLNFNFANSWIFKILSMMAYMTKFHKSLMFDSVNFTILVQAAKLTFVYTFILKGNLFAIFAYLTSLCALRIVMHIVIHIHSMLNILYLYAAL